MLINRSTMIPTKNIGAGQVSRPTCATISLRCPHVKFTIVDLNEQRVAAWN